MSTSQAHAAADNGPWLVVGLGNPGPEYAGNRHNIGFMVADLLAERIGGKFKTHKSRAQVVEGRLAGHRVVLAKPMSFMNLSGGPVTALRDFYKVPLERIVVVHDELDIDFAVLRLKRGGGDNGHNGLKSITKSLGPDYFRVRFGIGRPPGRMDVAAFVLKDFSSTERKGLDVEVDRAADAVESLVSDGLERAQSFYNS
ncbi:aminoacyl-tRNA hydrolase [Yinghuangia aomiensis]|uniref:Peptidyl-tRNA hydrolase n=1 Tax=Yinghuangia aomiensis TaxID=676205 RepID=A0ABP9GNL4_9ACTN